MVRLEQCLAERTLSKLLVLSFKKFYTYCLYSNRPLKFEGVEIWIQTKKLISLDFECRMKWNYIQLRHEAKVIRLIIHVDDTGQYINCHGNLHVASQLSTLTDVWIGISI